MSTGTYLAMSALIGGIYLGVGMLLWLSCKFASRREAAPSRSRIHTAVITVLLILTLGERLAYGLSNIRAYSPVLMASRAFPLYLPLTFRSFGKAIGLNAVRSEGPKI